MALYTRPTIPSARRLLVVMIAIAMAAIQGAWAQKPPTWRFSFLEESGADKANDILADRGCPCGCGRYLPGSNHAPACFGCSVGKTEISRVSEGLRDGRQPAEIILELGESGLIDVFADYTDKDLPEVWGMARRTAAGLGQHRVTLRTPGHSDDARRAIRLAECARDGGRFFAVQQSLVDHDGPWDVETLLRLADGHGLDTNVVRKCLEKKRIRAQVDKDNQHAQWFGIRRYPGLAVNRQAIDATPAALRKAILQLIEDESI